MFAAPGHEGSLVTLKRRYDNFIGGQWVAPVKGVYMADVSPVNGKTFCEVAKSSKEDVELALDAAHRARSAWGESSLADRASVLNAIADVLEANLTMLAVAESWENGKPVRETLAADLPSLLTTSGISRARRVPWKGVRRKSTGHCRLSLS